MVDGLRLLDEAMVTVLDGRLSPFTSGTLYCHTIAACQEVADVRRMTRWTELVERWLARPPPARIPVARLIARSIARATAGGSGTSTTLVQREVVDDLPHGSEGVRSERLVVVPFDARPD